MMFQLEYAVVKISIEALNSHFQRIRKQVGHSVKKKCGVYYAKYFFHLEFKPGDA